MRRYVFLMVAILIFTAYSIANAGPSGAKALFDSGEGTKVGIATGKTQQRPIEEVSQPKSERYAGLRYELLLQKEDGSFQKVSKARVFNTGDRIRIQVRTNYPGYLTIRNIGTSGNTHVLFSEYVEAKQLVEIPKTGSIRFVGAPGTEIVEILLSADPIYSSPDSTRVIASNPTPVQAPPPSSTASSVPPPPPPPSSSGTYDSGYQPPPPPSDIANLPPPPPQALAYNIEGSKSTRPKGAKDLVLVDNMDSKVTVVDRRNWKPSQTGAKDLVIESTGGSNYGVVPVSTLQNGGVLVTEIKLRHR